MSEILQESVSLGPKVVTKKDVNLAWLHLYFVNEVPHSFDKYIAPSLMWALMPILKKLYKDKKDLSEAYQRHLLLSNTQTPWGGGTITGIMAPLEATRAQEVYMDTPVTINDDLIYNTEAGLMGTLAGIGGSISSDTTQYIFIAITLPWAQQGNAIGALFPFIMFSLCQLVIGYYFAQLGFKLGRTAATKVVDTKMQVIIETLSILGLSMMEILAASYVKVSFTLAFTLSGKKFVIQKILDGVMPGILSLLTMGLVYFYFTKKGLNVTKTLIGLTIILDVLAGFGIL